MVDQHRKELEAKLVETMGMTMMQSAATALVESGIFKDEAIAAKDFVCGKLDEYIRDEYGEVRKELLDILNSTSAEQWGRDSQTVVKSITGKLRKWSERGGRVAVQKYLEERGRKEKVE